MLMVLDGTFHKTHESGLLGNIPQKTLKLDIFQTVQFNSDGSNQY